jgi:hypothetical protein
MSLLSLFLLSEDNNPTLPKCFPFLWLQLQVEFEGKNDCSLHYFVSSFDGPAFAIVSYVTVN